MLFFGVGEPSCTYNLYFIVFILKSHEFDYCSYVLRWVWSVVGLSNKEVSILQKGNGVGPRTSINEGLD